MTYAILGAGGSIGNALVHEIDLTSNKVRLMSRRGVALPGTESHRGDLLNYGDTLGCVEKADLAILTAGLTYNGKIWEEQWPVIMDNVIRACGSTGTGLLFFDNVYMYGLVKGRMTEDTPYNPCSRKGEVRARIARTLQDAMAEGRVKAMIARSADLYGPHITGNSPLWLTVFDRMMKGKNTQLMMGGERIHSYTYTRDAARGLLLLAGREECFGQVWHLPTSGESVTGLDFVDYAAEFLGTKPRYGSLGKGAMKAAGLFIPVLKEVLEMNYQNEYDYVFDSGKFNGLFHYTPRTYREGTGETLKWLREGE